MNLAVALFRTSIGRKIIMAVTGLVLVGFITAHLIGNLHVFGPADEMNGYSHFLQSLGPALWIFRAVVLATAVLHVWAAIVLTLENARARGPENYGFKHTIQATLASRTMRVTGLIVLFFIIYHIAHFTIGVNGEFFQGQNFKGRIAEVTLEHDFHLLGLLLVKAGTVVHDVHTMVILGFQSPIVSAFYIISVALLTVHLWHGIESMFQTLVLRTERWGRGLRMIARAYCVLYLAGNVLIVGAILGGFVQPHPAVEQVPVAETAPAAATEVQP
jgi:succinate dehydrogenase / fumarate reductase cytochrome b subunit